MEVAEEFDSGAIGFRTCMLGNPQRINNPHNIIIISVLQEIISVKPLVMPTSRYSVDC
jgi:hypothetical protein